MIPVLFPSSATTFTSNGLGRLSDAITCTVEEERNGKYELEMDYPVDGIHFDQIAYSRIILAKPSDGEDPQPFEIYEINKPINGKCTIRAEHISYRLLRIPVMPFGRQTLVTQALQGIKTNAAETCPFTFWTDKSSTGTFEVKQPKSIRACLGGESGSILQAFGGGEYKWYGFDVKLYQHRGADNGVVIRYGKNLTDLQQEENIAETITGVCPFWFGDDDNEQETLVTLPENVLHSSNAGNYPYYRTAVLDCSSAFQTQPTVSQLRAYAQNYMTANNIGVPKVSIKISFVPLWQSEEYRDKASIERVRLCDTVTVRFEKLGVDATAKVIKTKYNVLAERYDEIELGDAKSSMVKSVKAEVASAVESVEETQSLLRRNMTSAINQILAGQDGDIVFTIDENTGKRTNILAMNTSDPATANKILMINYEGIGGFSNGLNDRSGYTLAIARDGKINASAIYSGVINAALIKAGILSDGAGKNFWNMQTGQFSLSSDSTVGGSTVSQIASSAVNAQTQLSIFNKLTNNGETQGIYLSSGKLYINGSYIKSGAIQIKDGDTETFYANTSTGVVRINATGSSSITMKSGSINLGSGNFVVTSAGAVTIKNGSINLGSGNFTVSSAGAVAIKSGSINLGSGNFVVTSGGVLTANSADIKGTLKATTSGMVKTVQPGNAPYYNSVTYNYDKEITVGSGKISARIYNKSFEAYELAYSQGGTAEIIYDDEGILEDLEGVAVAEDDGYDGNDDYDVIEEDSWLPINYDPLEYVTNGNCGEIEFDADILVKSGNKKIPRRGIRLNPYNALEFKCSNLVINDSSTSWTAVNKEFYVRVSSSQKRKLVFKRGILVGVGEPESA